MVRRSNLISAADLRQQRAALDAEEKRIRDTERRRLGQLAAQAGLIGLKGVDNAQLLAGLREVAERFKDRPPSAFKMKLKRIQQRRNRLNRQERYTATFLRKQDTKEKFLLGNLIAKAGLQNADRDFLLGALLTLGDVKAGSPEYESCKALGEKILAGDYDVSKMRSGRDWETFDELREDRS